MDCMRRAQAGDREALSQMVTGWQDRIYNTLRKMADDEHEAMDLTQEAFGRGTIESQREALVGFDLAGRLSDILVEEEAEVSLGQELARLETSQAVADLRFATISVGVS